VNAAGDHRLLRPRRLAALLSLVLATATMLGTSAAAAATTTTTTMTPTTTTTRLPAPPLTDADGVPLGITPPVIGPAPTQHHSILAIGDSTLAQGIYLLPDVLAEHGFDVTLHDAHSNASGLLDPIDGLSAVDILDRELAAHPDVDTVVFEWVGVCAVACGPGKLAYGSKPFYDAWRSAARALVAHARSRDLDVVWAIAPPPAPAPTADPPTQDWNSLPMRHEVATKLVASTRRYPKAFGIRTVDWSQALSDTSGQWQSQLSYDGGVHDVRLDDHVHLTEDGSRRTSVWTAATLAQLWR
jgi:hypothetical protein